MSLSAKPITPGKVFGTWDAPVTDEDHEHGAEAPEGECMYCHEPIQLGDNGRVTPIREWNGQPVGGQIEHRECALRSVMGGIGHHVDHTSYCHGGKGPDAGLTYRQSALLTWEFFQETQWSPTPGQLRRWRLRLAGVGKGGI